MKAPIRNAFVLGAGLGTRLKTLTASKPKPLIPICGKPLITFAFDHLIRNGAQNIVVNTHHCAESYGRAFPRAAYHAVPLHFEHEARLLETAGGIKNVERFLRAETFIVYNGDILCDLPLERAIRHHFDTRNEVTLVLRSTGGPLHIALDATGRVIDVADRLRTGTAEKFLFTGISIVSPSFLHKIPSRTKISVIPIFMHMIQRAQGLGGVVIDEGHWWDIGSREKYLEAHRYFTQETISFVRDDEHSGWPQWVHPDAKVSPTAKITGATAIGPGTVVGDRASLHDCVLWENANVAPGAQLQSCVVTAGQTAHGRHENFDF